MQVLHVNATDVRGGAGRAANRLHRGLGDIGVDSSMLVRYQYSDDADVYHISCVDSNVPARIRSVLDRAPLLRYRNRASKQFSPAWIPDRLVEMVKRLDPDVVHLHWVGGGMLRAETIGRFQRPVVWTMHDMWPVTGGCHYSGSCAKFEASCGSCPKLGSDSESDISARLLRRKSRAWDTTDIQLVSPSRWLAGVAERSSLFDGTSVEVIHNGVQLDQFQPDESELPARLGFPDHKRIVLFGAVSATSDPRKGHDLLLDALEYLPALVDSDDVVLAVFGGDDDSRLTSLDIETRYLGDVSESTLHALYSEADVLVAPSRQDNLPNTVVEALATGTPCVAFDVGGMPDMIEHRSNGYLAEPLDPRDLATGIAWTVTSANHPELETNARRTAERRFDIADTANRYRELYERVVREHGATR